MVYGSEGHNCSLRCNCHHNSDARKKYYQKEGDCIVINFEQKCPKCNYNFWHVVMKG